MSAFAFGNKQPLKCYAYRRGTNYYNGWNARLCKIDEIFKWWPNKRTSLKQCGRWRNWDLVLVQIGLQWSNIACALPSQQLKREVTLQPLQFLTPQSSSSSSALQTRNYRVCIAHYPYTEHCHLKKKKNLLGFLHRLVLNYLAYLCTKPCFCWTSKTAHTKTMRPAAVPMGRSSIHTWGPSFVAYSNHPSASPQTY